MRLLQGLNVERKYDLRCWNVFILYQWFTHRISNHAEIVYNLMCMRGFQATEPKDYVFALLGHYSAQFGNSRGRPFIEADYSPSISAKQVFHQVAIRLLESGHVKVLNAVRPKPHWDGEFSSPYPHTWSTESPAVY